MLTPLSGPYIRPLSAASADPFIGRVTDDPALGGPDRALSILLAQGPADEWPAGFRAVLVTDDSVPISSVRVPDAYLLHPQMRYLAPGDVVRIDPQRGFLYALYRRTAASNSFLLTERCDNLCLMCSQPPRREDDDWIVDELMQVIPLVSPETAEVGLTGGEPALLGERLLTLISALRDMLPRTGVHVLTNGRRFAEEGFARSLARVGHPDLVLGIPLYSDVPEEHDYVVQARGAFQETVRGILNLKRAGIRVELRTVIHGVTAPRLPEFARFVARNLLFVDHVALMGLELVGFAKANLAGLWADPVDYQEPLSRAVETLDRAGMRVSIYNHPLCALPSQLHPFARQSISDWKNEYIEACDPCEKRSICGGFFVSSRLRRSRGIRPFLSPSPVEGPADAKGA